MHANTRLFTLEQAAERTGLGVKTLRRAIRQDYQPGEQPMPRLAAKRGLPRGRGHQYLIPEDALAEFIDQLPDA